MQPNKVYQTDAIEGMVSLVSDSVDMIFTDPPYGISYKSNHYKGENPHDAIVNDNNFQISRFLQEAYRVTKDGGALYLCCRWDVAQKWLPAFEGTSWKVKTLIVWMKNNWSAGDLKGSFGNQYENIIFAVKGRHLIRGRRHPNIWQHDRVTSKNLISPAQKPVSLVKQAIEASSDVGDIILDPYCGSGTTGVAAKELGRDVILMDMYYPIAEQASLRTGMPLVAEHEQSFRNDGHCSFVGSDWFEKNVTPDDFDMYFNYIKNNWRS